MKLAVLAAKIIGAITGTVAVVTVGAGIATAVIVDKDFIEEQLSSLLNRHVTVEKIESNVFSVLSGFQVDKVVISNYKTKKQLEKLKGKPVPKGDVFISLDRFVFKLDLGTITESNLDLRELVLYKPVINIYRNKNGVFNFSDLTTSKPDEKKEEEPEEKKESEQPGKPLTADDLPVSIAIGKLGIEDGLITFTDGQFKEAISIYAITAKVVDLQIDGDKLVSKNGMKLNVGLAIKNKGPLKRGGAQSFDIALSVNGSVKVFDLDTRKLDPEIALKLGSPRGQVSGLEIFNGLKNYKALEKYTGKLAFLKETVKWKNALIGIWYKNGFVKLQNGKIVTPDFVSNIAGSTNLNTQTLKLDMDMTVDDKHRDAMKKELTKNLKKVITGKTAKVVKAEDVAEIGMKPLLNKEKHVYFDFDIQGTWSKPKVKLRKPKIPALKDLVNEAVKEAGDQVKKEAAKRVNKEVSQKKKVVKKKAAKKAKSVRKKLGF